MALQQLPGQGIRMNSYGTHTSTGSNSNTMDAAGKSMALIGNIVWTSGAGTKTLSAAGAGKIAYRVSSSTFADAGTNLRIGINGIANTGIEDTIYSVYADLVGGTDAIPSNTFMKTTMQAGSKTFSYGETIAIVFEMTARAGADVVVINTFALSDPSSSAGKLPYKTNDTGVGPVKSGSSPTSILIQFDDGTIGWIAPFPTTMPLIPSLSSLSFGLNTTPDEYGVRFRVPFTCSVNGFSFPIGNIDTTDDFEIILYGDPTGTPTVITSLAIDPDISTTSGISTYHFKFNSDQTLQANTWYCFAIRPTTANMMTTARYNLGAGNEAFREIFDFGPDCFMVSRTNQTGAFTTTQLYDLPVFSLFINKVDDGVGVETSYTFG